MTRSILSGLLGLLSVAIVGSLPLACQSGGVGDPCTPEDEYDPGFAGFKVTEENIESRSFQCQTRICLVNHFQGRSSCPLGQTARIACNPEGASTCAEGETCTEAATSAPVCNVNGDCASGNCDTALGVCTCSEAAHCPGAGADPTWFCPTPAEGEPRVCKSFVCFNPTTGCQSAEGTDNEGKACCVPGTNTPVASPVCGQCEKRNAENAVYCSCRCGAAEGTNNPEDENFNFCECPDGFSCEEIRADVGLGDPLISGKYCVKLDTLYNSSDAQGSCGAVTGNSDNTQGCVSGVSE
ncbi:hypothetical protein [Chondromyces apiculatus]|uniref:MEGF11 protein n=1 Tax=Chondromyces apiculatus DSM 436 TaxID=1192034 RepID=A0A017TF23_9BACT|nr:hypothetical protein [Chondromyces apiculatus]EYF07420.1 MEGF11 protein [Chondromyces apiculatus DSM 436]